MTPVPVPKTQMGPRARDIAVMPPDDDLLSGRVAACPAVIAPGPLGPPCYHIRIALTPAEVDELVEHPYLTLVMAGPMPCWSLTPEPRGYVYGADLRTCA